MNTERLSPEHRGTAGRPDNYAVDEASFLRVSGLAAAFGEVRVLESVDFEVGRGQTLVVLGESGCGKTTLLKAVAGLVPTVAGEVRLGGIRISDVPARERGVIYLDQEALLFEHLTVSENVAFAMRLRKRPAAEVTAAVAEMLDSVGLTGHGGKREWQLSGGQKQRVAFARAVLAAPRLLLLDEPFGSLDAGTRGQMQALFAELMRRRSLTSIFVTHDAREALVVGDRFARMSRGKLLAYPDRGSFAGDPDTGIAAEIEFWRRASEITENRRGFGLCGAGESSPRNGEGPEPPY